MQGPKAAMILMKMTTQRMDIATSDRKALQLHEHRKMTSIEDIRLEIDVVSRPEGPLNETESMSISYGLLRFRGSKHGEFSVGREFLRRTPIDSQTTYGFGRPRELRKMVQLDRICVPM
ncbi:hypothetical protein Tco_0196320 [Tanacetum coccineum]